MFHKRLSTIEIILLFQLLILIVGEVAMIWGFSDAKTVCDKVLWLYWIITIPLFSVLVIRTLLVDRYKKREKD